MEEGEEGKERGAELMMSCGVIAHKYIEGERKDRCVEHDGISPMYLRDGRNERKIGRPVDWGPSTHQDISRYCSLHLE